MKVKVLLVPLAQLMGGSLTGAGSVPPATTLGANPMGPTPPTNLPPVDKKPGNPAIDDKINWDDLMAQYRELVRTGKVRE